MQSLIVEFTDAEIARLTAAGFVGVGLTTFVRSCTMAALRTKPTGAEEWRPFRGGEYEASSHGNIRRATPGVSTFVGRVMKPSDGAGGYTQVLLSLVAKPTRFYTHRVVAESFFGPCPAGHIVNHIDGNKRNNALLNLEYITHRENAVHAVANLPRHRGATKPRAPLKGRQSGDSHWSRRDPSKVARGEKMGSSTLTADSVRSIRRRAAGGERQCDLAHEFNVSVAQVSRVVRGLRWAHIKEE